MDTPQNSLPPAVVHSAEVNRTLLQYEESYIRDIARDQWFAGFTWGMVFGALLMAVLLLPLLAHGNIPLSTLPALGGR